MGDVGHGGETKHTLTELKQIMLWHNTTVFNKSTFDCFCALYTDSSR